MPSPVDPAAESPGRGGAPPPEDVFRRLVESVPDHAIFMLDPGGRILSWNLGAERIKGYAPEEIIGRHFSVFYSPEDVAAGKPERGLKIASSIGGFEDEGERVRKDGTRFIAGVSITALRDESGRLRGFAKVTRDITERRRMEEDLRRSEERFRLLVAAVSDYAIFMLDPEGRIASWNLGGERIKGYRAEEILGRHFSVFYPAEEVAAGKPERALRLAAAEGRFEEDGWRLRKDGMRFFANVVITALRDGTGALIGFTKVTRDITARKRAEEQARELASEREARLQAQAANGARSAYLSMVAHELRTPLTSLKAYIGAMRRKQAGGGTIDRDILRRLDAQVDRFGKLVRDIGDSARLEAGRGLELELADLDLGDAVRETVRFHALAVGGAPGARHAIVLLDSAGPLPMAGDRGRLEQVVSNLIENAVKYSPDGGPIEVALATDGRDHTLTVRDGGIGVPPAELPRLAERYFRASNVSDRHFPGLGLGLAICREIVERHGGRLEIESRLGAGTTVSVRLPAKGVRRGGFEPPTRGSEVRSSVR